MWRTLPRGSQLVLDRNEWKRVSVAAEMTRATRTAVSIGGKAGNSESGKNQGQESRP